MLGSCADEKMQTLSHFGLVQIRKCKPYHTFGPPTKAKKWETINSLVLHVFADTAMFFLHLSRKADTTILFFHFQGNYWLFVVFLCFCLLFFDTTMDLLMFSKQLLTLLRFSKINKNRKKQKKGNFQKSTKRFSVFIFKLPRKDLRHNFLNIIFRRSGGL